MTQSKIQTSFASGELSPALFGHLDLTKFHSGASTMRNMFVDFRGGAKSRAGTAFVGVCKQAGTLGPPRDIRFQFSLTQSFALEFGNLYMRVKSDGAYVTETAKNITAISQANPGGLVSNSHGFSDGDWIYIASVGGMTQLNGLTYIVAGATTNTFTLVDMFGVAVNTTNYSAYTSGGTAARIYTLTTPYITADIPSLKFAQSADVMTLCHPSYPPYALTRVSNTNWTLVAETFATSISPPSSTSIGTTSTGSTGYSYIVTAVAQSNGEESISSPIANITNSANISTVLATITVAWNLVTGADSYNIYKAPSATGTVVPVGSLFGYVGSGFGRQFVDTNIIADYARTPPLHRNPFAKGSLLRVSLAGGSGGSGYADNITSSITTTSGSGAVIQGLQGSGVIVGAIVYYGGANYVTGDRVDFLGAGGSGGFGFLVAGPTSGTYPSVVAYFQQRRVYANSNNNPDTYWMSKTGLYNNMDASPIPQDDDAITGTPWAQQVNGVQWLVPMPGGLVILTGLGAWQLSGGQLASAITPSSQSAQPQAYNGCSPLVPPITINYDILYVQAKGSTVRDLQYNFFVNIYTGTDLSMLSNHLFDNKQILQWAWAEEPNKLVWAIRDDGTMLSLTYLKEQEVTGWARHDTAGLFVSVCNVSEPPIDAIYVIVKRYVNGAWFYYSERMDNRLWTGVEDVWAVDCGLGYPQTEPAATLTASSATGDQRIGSVSLVYGGAGYVAPSVVAVDPTGTGATFTATVSGGVITAINVVTPGEGYSACPVLSITDSAGSGAVANPVVTNPVTLTASTGVFTAGNVGDVVRMGGGVLTVTGYTSVTVLSANVDYPITQTLQDDPDNRPIPQTSGNWTITTPTTVVRGLNHLEGKSVAILADGSVMAQRTVTSGAITLDQAASQITIGLPFIAQLQSLYLSQGADPAFQANRKDIFSVAIRVEASRGLEMGQNQPDASCTTGGVAPAWTKMTQFKDRGAGVVAGRAIPLFTGDQAIIIKGTWAVPGQVAVQQQYPLPMNVTAMIPEFVLGDSDG